MSSSGHMASSSSSLGLSSLSAPNATAATTTSAGSPATLGSAADAPDAYFPPFLGTAGGPTVRQATKAALLRMLALDASPSDPAASVPQPAAAALQPVAWKVLVLDTTARDILSPLLSVSDLRDAGVTVHMALHSPRQPIPDVPAVYFCDPTQAAIVRIAEDMAANLYDAFHLNFTSPLPRALLEDLAQRLVATGSAGLVAKVVDQYLPLRVLDEQLVSLALPNALTTLHSPSTPESELMALMDSLATGLLGVCITLGVIPYIRFASGAHGGPAEMVGRRLESKLRDVMHAQLGPGKVPVLDPEAPRPVVLILDRTLDLGTPVAHSWLYAPLVADVLEFKLNRVTCLVDDAKPGQPAGGPKVKKTFDIDVGKDSFWRASAGMPFPEVADMVDQDLAKYKRDAQEVLSATGAKSLEEMGQMDVGLNAKHLKSALTQLPALTARKRTLDTHMHIATALLAAIQARKLDTLYEVQQKPAKATVLDTLRDAVTTPMDAARLAIVYLSHVLQPSASPQQVAQAHDDVDEVLKAVATRFPESPDALDAIKYVKSLRSLALASLSSGAGAPTKSSPAPGTNPDHLFGRFAGRLTETLAQAGTHIASSGTLGGAVESIVGGVKSLVLAGRGTYAAKRVEAVLDGIEEPGMTTVDVRVAPPRGGGGPGSRSPAPARSGTPALGGGAAAGAAGCIVCMVGGGSVLEYRQVLEVAKGRKRPVVYVGTDILAPEQVVEQLAALGRAQRA